MVVRGCVYLPDRGRVRVDDGRIRSEFDPREDGPYHSRCARLAVVGRLGKPAPWMGDAALRKFTSLGSLRLGFLDGGPGPDALRGLTALTAISVIGLPTFTLASLAGLSRLREVVIHVLSDVGLPPQNLTEIDDGPFRGLRELESLSIHGAGNLTRIHGAAFRDLVNLKSFAIVGSKKRSSGAAGCPNLVSPNLVLAPGSRRSRASSGWTTCSGIGCANA